MRLTPINSQDGAFHRLHVSRCQLSEFRRYSKHTLFAVCLQYNSRIVMFVRISDEKYWRSVFSLVLFTGKLQPCRKLLYHKTVSGFSQRKVTWCLWCGVVLGFNTDRIIKVSPNIPTHKLLIALLSMVPSYFRNLLHILSLVLGQFVFNVV